MAHLPMIHDGCKVQLLFPHALHIFFNWGLAVAGTAGIAVAMEIAVKHLPVCV